MLCFSTSKGLLNPFLPSPKWPCRHKMLDSVGDVSLFARNGNEKETGKYENEKASANPKHGWYPSGSSHELWNKKATGKYKDEVTKIIIMYVVKRDGRQETVHFDKITARLKKLSYGLSIDHCDPVLVSQKVCAGVYKGVTTSQLDELAAETSAALTANHPDYASLAARIAVSNLHKNTKKSFSETIKDMYNHVSERSAKKAALIADDVYEIIMKVLIQQHNVEQMEHLMELFPCLRVFNDTARLLTKDAPARGRLNLMGMEEQRARDLFYALWIPDLFMERVQSNDQWSLFCPNEAPGLADCWGQEFETLYTHGEAKTVVQAQNLWFEVLKSQIETGTPYMLYKDTCNRKSNQQNLGTIKSSNLCTEIIEYTSPTETAVCNLASIALPRYVREKGVPAESQPSKLVGSRGSSNRYFDFNKLAEITSTVTTNLNKVIDVNYYPVETAKTSNLRHRPIGIGVQGLADTFILLGMAFDSPEAQQLNKDIFETIYYHALKTSSEIAAKEGTYETYIGSPVSKGVLQPDMWGVTPSDLWDWSALRAMISKNGVRNSLLVAPMPTASTSQILGNNECFEPYTSNIYSRRVLSGEFVVVNKHLLHDLTEMGLWTPTLKNQIIYEDGSVQKIGEIPEDLKAIYKTVWEIKQRTLVDMAVDRGCYIDQSQSLNIHMDQPNFGKLTSLHFHTWSKGLKTGMYYLRSRAAADAIKFTVDTSILKENTKTASEEDNKNTEMSQMVCSLLNRDECLACGS
ncbi:ribonucleoside-diphosphate reductase large subunit [Tanacetum coccineum]